MPTRFRTTSPTLPADGIPPPDLAGSATLGQVRDIVDPRLPTITFPHRARSPGTRFAVRHVTMRMGAFRVYWLDRVYHGRGRHDGLHFQVSGLRWSLVAWRGGQSALIFGPPRSLWVSRQHCLRRSDNGRLGRDRRTSLFHPVPGGRAASPQHWRFPRSRGLNPAHRVRLEDVVIEKRDRLYLSLDWLRLRRLPMQFSGNNIFVGYWTFSLVSDNPATTSDRDNLRVEQYRKPSPPSRS